MAEQQLSSEDPATVLKNAKSSLKALEEALKTKDPWDRDIEFHRRNARRQFLHLIFAFPYSPQTVVMDNPIWLETSHRCIAAYRARITAVEEAVAARSRTKAEATNSGEGGGKNGNKGRKGGGGGGGGDSGPGPVELRKLVHRFRQYLADEEKFWTTFILRFVRSFDLQEARPYINALNLSSTDNHNGPGTGIGIGNGNGNGNGNGVDGIARTSAFPEEREPSPPPTADQREKKVAMLTKAMVSLGDLARYREQYNERQGRPKAGSEDVPFHRATKGNGHRNGKSVGSGGGEDLPRPRNYTRAMACYTQARMLYPDSGHAFHQIAILCSYQADYFGQILNYYRSLCVDHPFTTASDNLVHLLTKVLEASKTEQLQSSDPNASNANATNEEEAPRLVIERFKRDIVKLHGMWRVKRTTEAELAAHTEHTLSRFNKLLAERVLPIGLIVKVYVAALGAHRTISVVARKSTSTDGGKRNKAHAQKMEGFVLLHIMELHLCLVNLATEQLTFDAITTFTSDTPSGVGLPPPPLPPPAERITAVLRRVLQTLRVASKWLLGNQDYLYRAANPDKSPPPGLTRTLGEFWPAYARFATRLSTMFPKDDVRDIQKVTLDEDVELAGFAPLKKLLKAPEKLPVGTANQAHPNEEYLLRIRDVLKDLYALVKSQMNPLKYQNGVYTSKTESASKITIASSMLAQPEAMLPLTIQSRTDVIAAPGVAGQLRASEDDEIASVSTEDPVTMAMRATLESSGNDDFPDEEMEDEEQILVQPGAFSRVDPLFESTPMLHGGRLSLSGPSVGPSRDPHAFNLSDLALHPEFNQPYVPQLPSPRYDAFGLTLTGSPVVNPNVLNPYPPLNHPIGSSALFYQEQQMPIPFARQPIGAISSPPRASQLLFSSPRHAPGPIGPPGPQDLLTSNHVLYSNANENPISPVRVPHRLSVSANVNMNTPTLSGRPLEVQVPPTSSPPKTAQDLLMRVLGTANTSGLGPGPGPASPGVIGSPTKGRLPRQSTSPPRGGNDRSEEGIPPLIFGTMNGQSIWAPRSHMGE